MRADALGLFWEDKPPEPKAKKEVVKRTPPEPTWLSPDYLPGLEEARRFPIDLMTEQDLLDARSRNERFIYDMEVYTNYVLVVFRSILTGKACFFEETLHKRLNTAESQKLEWIVANFTLVGFNSINYDIVMLNLLINGVECDIIKEESDNSILNGARPYEILRRHKIKALKCDHIDLIEVAPLRAGLKVYGGRLHVPKMQDLPFAPNTILSDDQITITRWYCINDTTSTAFLNQCLEPQVALRYVLSNENGIDLRSKSDAQIAESLISQEYKRRTGTWPQRQAVVSGTVHRYNTPSFLRFSHPALQHALETVQNAKFIVGEDGYIEAPPEIEGLKFTIGNTTYQMSVGGMHSCEKTTAHQSDSYYQLVDKDVTSYYPAIIIECGLFPSHLGRVFLDIYRGIRDRRVAAKLAGLKEIAETLKIVVNGTYGKLSSSWSVFYAPEIGFHVTLTGQLSLLMYIEWLEVAGISVVSANTDGVMVKCPRHLLPLLETITKAWEAATRFEMESKNYKAIYSKDVNNYIAIDEKNKTKGKGLYADPWSPKREGPEELKLHKNPKTSICNEAVVNYLTIGKPIDISIRECRDITKFTSIQSVDGGAVKIWPDRTEYLGKSIRWYYGAPGNGEIVRAANGNKVGKTDDAMPLMELPKEFPDDVNYEWYENECEKILIAIGAKAKPPKLAKAA